MGIGPLGDAAVFLDRDGVLTEPVWNPDAAEYESPHRLEDLRLCPNVLEPLGALRRQGFALFIVSNQPSYAKGKTSLESLEAIARALEDRFLGAGIEFRATYYCYHHPRGVVPAYTGVCPCRKPGAYFLEVAAERHRIDLRRSWMIGDRDSDVECGQQVGCRTALIADPRAWAHQGASRPDLVARDLASAVDAILSRNAAAPDDRSLSRAGPARRGGR